MDFRLQGLDGKQFGHLYGLSDEALTELGAKRYTVDAKPGFPDRVEVRDLEIGETAILINFEHLAVETPYRSRHAIFVREGAIQSLDVINVVPEVIRIRPISLRAFDAIGNMLHADLVEGENLSSAISEFFRDADVAYLHVHFAKRGCYAALVTRA
jgi:Protein of unknown function (DUF1203)